MEHRIEEVKKILKHFREQHFVDSIARKIDDYYSQLFPQSLDDKELPRNPYGEASKTNPKVLLSDFPQQYEAYERCKKDMLALLQPKIEEAREQARDEIDGVKSALAELNKKLDDREDDLIIANREERERIIKIVNTPYGQVENEVSTNSVLLFRRLILSRIGKP